MSFFLVIAGVLAVVSVCFLLKPSFEGGGGSHADHRVRIAHFALLPVELAARIFSRDDRDFIEGTSCLTLRRLYLAERRKVASHWLRQVMHEVGRIMAEHRLRSRQSPNLDVLAEIKLLLQYLELQLLCASMLVLVRIFGPHALADLASRVGDLYERIGRCLPGGVVVRTIEPTRNLAA